MIPNKIRNLAICAHPSLMYIQFQIFYERARAAKKENSGR
jgi:hypothetical protein